MLSSCRSPVSGDGRVAVAGGGPPDPARTSAPTSIMTEKASDLLLILDSPVRTASAGGNPDRARFAAMFWGVDVALRDRAAPAVLAAGVRPRAACRPAVPPSRP